MRRYLYGLVTLFTVLFSSSVICQTAEEIAHELESMKARDEATESGRRQSEIYQSLQSAKSPQPEIKGWEIAIENPYASTIVLEKLLFHKKVEGKSQVLDSLDISWVLNGDTNVVRFYPDDIEKIRNMNTQLIKWEFGRRETFGSEIFDSLKYIYNQFDIDNMMVYKEITYKPN